MKKIRLLTFSFIICLPAIYAQEYTAFPKTNGLWKDELYTCQVDYQTYEKQYSREYHEIISAGDTLINDTLYFKLIEDGSYKGAFRQDSCKIFYRAAASNKEALLYDFCITDTFYSPYFEKTFTVTKIDSVQMGDAKRKRIFFDDILGVEIGKFWIDGMGSSGGLLKPTYITDFPTCDLCCGVEQNLVCYSVNGNLLYLNENYYSCDSLLTHLKEEKLSPLKIYPNPSEGGFYIEFNASAPIDFIEIITMQGTLVSRTTKPDKNRLEFHIANPGMYLVRVKQKNKMELKKVIVN